MLLTRPTTLVPRGLQHLLVLFLTHALTALLNQRTHEGRHPSLHRRLAQTERRSHGKLGS